MKADALEDAVWLAAIRTLLGSRVWEEAWARMRIDESRIADDITSLLAQRDRLQAQEERLANLYAYGDLDEVAYRGKRSELAGQRDRLGEELQALEWRLLQAKEERVSLRRDIEAWFLGEPGQAASTHVPLELKRRFVEELVDHVALDASGPDIRLTIVARFPAGER